MSPSYLHPRISVIGQVHLGLDQAASLGHTIGGATAGVSSTVFICFRLSVCLRFVRHVPFLLPSVGILSGSVISHVVESGRIDHPAETTVSPFQRARAARGVPRDVVEPCAEGSKPTWTRLYSPRIVSLMIRSLSSPLRHYLKRLPEGLPLDC